MFGLVFGSLPNNYLYVSVKIIKPGGYKLSVRNSVRVSIRKIISLVKEIFFCILWKYFNFCYFSINFVHLQLFWFETMIPAKKRLQQTNFNSTFLARYLDTNLAEVSFSSVSEGPASKACNPLLPSETWCYLWQCFGHDASSNPARSHRFNLTIATPWSPTLATSPASCFLKATSKVDQASLGFPPLALPATQRGATDR